MHNMVKQDHVLLLPFFEPRKSPQLQKFQNTCRFDNQVPNEKLVEKYFLVAKLAQYFVFEEDRQPTPYCKQEI